MSNSDVPHEHHQPFTHDLYPGLNAELDAAFSGWPDGRVDSDDKTTGIQVAAYKVIAEQQELADDAMSWADAEFNTHDTHRQLVHLKSIEPALGMFVPESLEELLTISPNLERQIGRLFYVKRKLKASGERTPQGTLLSDDMKLVLIPWQFFQDNLDHLGGAVRKVRPAQHTEADLDNDDLFRIIEDGRLRYRNFDPSAPDKWISTSLYLKKQTKIDGPWGLMFAQVHSELGVQNQQLFSAGRLSVDGTERYTCAGENVDALGVLEWLSLTFQITGGQLSTYDERNYSLLLANRYETSEGPRVPLARFASTSMVPKFEVSTIAANATIPGMGVRLAVI